MKKNIGTTDRVVRLCIAFLFFIVAFFFSGFGRWGRVFGWLLGSRADKHSAYGARVVKRGEKSPQNDEMKSPQNRERKVHFFALLT
jgi:hypothetical protein